MQPNPPSNPNPNNPTPSNPTSSDSLRDRIKAMNAGTHQEPDGMCVIKAHNMKIKIKELTELANANPGHPFAKTLAGPIKTLPPEREVRVSKVEVEALMDNREVIFSEHSEEFNGKTRIIKTKTLGPSLDLLVSPEPDDQPTP